MSTLMHFYMCLVVCVLQCVLEMDSSTISPIILFAFLLFAFSQIKNFHFIICLENKNGKRIIFCMSLHAVYTF